MASQENKNNDPVPKKKLIGSDVVCNGLGRKWVKDYKGVQGVYAGQHDASNADLIRLESNEIIHLYSNEYEII